MNTTIEPPRSGAALNRHRSFQSYETPREFIVTVEARFGALSVDLAASKENAKAEDYITEQTNSLKIDWHKIDLIGPMWLNPPFSDIAPWAKKCMAESLAGATILFLTPASIGSNWFANYVNGHAVVYALRPRLSFDGRNPYPKDCILSHFTPGGKQTGFECWKWK